MHDRNKAQYWIERLRLEPHPEGGHYKEVYKANETIFKTNLPKRYQGDRAFSTSIYFLLQKNEFSAFHRLKSDETWYFHGGDPIELLIIDHRGILEKMVIVRSLSLLFVMGTGLQLKQRVNSHC